MLIDNANNSTEPEEERTRIKELFVEPPSSSVTDSDGTPVWWHGEDEAAAGIGSMFNVEAFIAQQAEKSET